MSVSRTPGASRTAARDAPWRDRQVAMETVTPPGPVTRLKVSTRTAGVWSSNSPVIGVRP